MSRFYSKATIQLPMNQEIFTELDDHGYEQDFEINIKEFKPYDILIINIKCIPQFAISNKYSGQYNYHHHNDNGDQRNSSSSSSSSDGGRGGGGGGVDTIDRIIPGIDHCLLAFKLSMINNNDKDDDDNSSSSKRHATAAAAAAQVISNNRSPLLSLLPIKAVLCNGEYDITVTHSHGLQSGRYILSISLASPHPPLPPYDDDDAYHIPSNSSHSYGNTYSFPPMSPLSLNKTMQQLSGQQLLGQQHQQVSSSQALYVSYNITPTVNATSLSSEKPVSSIIKSNQTHYYRFISNDPDKMISFKLIPRTKTKHTGYVFNDLDLYVSNRHQSLITVNRRSFVWSNCYSGISQIDILPDDQYLPDDHTEGRSFLIAVVPYGLNHSIQDKSSIPVVEDGITYDLSVTLSPVVSILSIPISAQSSLDFTRGTTVTNGSTIDVTVSTEQYLFFKIPSIQNKIAASRDDNDSYGKVILLLHHSDDPEVRNLLVHEQLIAYYNSNLHRLIDECKVDLRSGSTIYTSDAYHDRTNDGGIQHHLLKTSTLSEMIPTIYLSPDVAYPTKQCFLQKVPIVSLMMMMAMVVMMMVMVVMMMVMVVLRMGMRMLGDNDNYSACEDKDDDGYDDDDTDDDDDYYVGHSFQRPQQSISDRRPTGLEA